MTNSNPTTKIMKNEISTHTNANNETYYSKEDENGKTIYSFSELFAIYSFSEIFADTWSLEEFSDLSTDTWSQEDEWQI